MIQDWMNGVDYAISIEKINSESNIHSSHLHFLNVLIFELKKISDLAAIEINTFFLHDDNKLSRH